MKTITIDTNNILNNVEVEANLADKYLGKKVGDSEDYGLEFLTQIWTEINFVRYYIDADLANLMEEKFNTIFLHK